LCKRKTGVSEEEEEVFVGKERGRRAREATLKGPIKISKKV
jgi:hypothetical protein